MTADHSPDPPRRRRLSHKVTTRPQPTGSTRLTNHRPTADLPSPPVRYYLLQEERAGLVSAAGHGSQFPLHESPAEFPGSAGRGLSGRMVRTEKGWPSSLSDRESWRSSADIRPGRDRDRLSPGSPGQQKVTGWLSSRERYLPLIWIGDLSNTRRWRGLSVSSSGKWWVCIYDEVGRYACQDVGANPIWTWVTT